MVLEELVAVLGWDLRGEGDLKRFQSGMRQAESQLSAFASKASTLVTAISVAVGAGMAALATSVIGVSAQFETFETSLETLEGSSEKAKSAMDWITNFAAKTPYDLEGVTAAFIKLRSYGIDPTDETLQILGDTASAMSKPLDQAVEAFADATNFQFERLREFGLTTQQQGDKVTFQWTKNGQTLNQVVKKNGAEIQKFLKDHFGETFNGAMLRQSKTWSGMMSNLGDSWMLFQKRVGDAGFFALVKGKLADLLDYVGRLVDNGTIDRWAKSMSNGLTSVANLFSVIAVRVAADIEFLSSHFETLKPILIAVGAAMAALFVWAFPVVSGFVALGLAVDDLITYFQGGKSVIGDFIEWCKRLPETISQAARAISTGLNGIDWGTLGNNAGRMLVNAIAEGIKAIGGVFVTAFRNISWGDVAGAIVAGLNSVRQFYLGYWQGLGTEVIQIIKGWFDLDWSAIGANIGQGILTGLQSIGDSIKAWLASIFQKPAWLETMFPTSPTKTDQSVVMPKNSGFVPPRRPGMKKLSAWESLGGDYIRSDAMSNASGNFGRMSGSGAAQAMNSTVNDNRNQAVSVTVNQTVQQATQAPAAAAQATGNAVAGAGARRSTWHEAGDKI